MKPLNSKITVKDQATKFYLGIRHVNAFKEGRLQSLTVCRENGTLVKYFEGEDLLALFLSLIGLVPGRKGPIVFWSVSIPDPFFPMLMTMFKLCLTAEQTEDEVAV